MSISSQLDFDLSAVPTDVFDLADDGLTLETLTEGHGMPENLASSPCACSTLCGPCGVSSPAC